MSGRPRPRFQLAAERRPHAAGPGGSFALQLAFLTFAFNYIPPELLAARIERVPCKSVSRFRSGRVITDVVVLEPGATLTEEAVPKALDSPLARYKLPNRVPFDEENAVIRLRDSAWLEALQWNLS